MQLLIIKEMQNVRTPIASVDSKSEISSLMSQMRLEADTSFQEDNAYLRNRQCLSP